MLKIWQSREILPKSRCFTRASFAKLKVDLISTLWYIHALDQ